MFVDSLNRESYVTLVACISPNIDDVHETIQTLDFAQRVKRVKNKPVVNRLVSEYKVSKFCKTIKLLV